MKDDSAQTTETQAPKDRSTEFVADAGGQDTTSAETMLVLAYIGLWLVIFGFVLLTQKRQRALDKKLQDLESALAKAESSPEAP
jgi:CcmD family protein